MGVQFGVVQLLSITIIAFGIISLGLVSSNGHSQNFVAARLAFITGIFIAAYSLVDGLGARVSESSWGYFSCMTIGNGLLAIMFLSLTSPKTFLSLYAKGRITFLVGGGASFLSYGIVTWAFTQSPIAIVTALRETSIVFALLLGAFFLRERLNLFKACATFLTLFGTVLLRFAKGE